MCDVQCTVPQRYTFGNRLSSPRTFPYIKAVKGTTRGTAAFKITHSSNE